MRNERVGFVSFIKTIIKIIINEYLLNDPRKFEIIHIYIKGYLPSSLVPSKVFSRYHIVAVMGFKVIFIFDFYIL